MRDVNELKLNAFHYWPKVFADIAKERSDIPRLIETQDKLISLLNLADSHPFAWKNILSQTKDFPPNLLLKHLMVLSDVGGEKLMRFKVSLPEILPDNKMEFAWKGEKYEYTFRTLSGRHKWSNVQLKVDGARLSVPSVLSGAIEDVINLILFGGSMLCDNLPIEIMDKCIVGNLIGVPEELETFVKQRYIWVSKITSGATSNSLGNIAQKFVIEFLKENLPTWDFTKKSIPGISQNESTLTKFDIVASSPNGVYCAIEASFQETTNSVIERKSLQAPDRQRILHSTGNAIAYIIDGIGNFERQQAIKNIIRYSDCTVTYKPEELKRLIDFLLNFENSKIQNA